ncbi:nucleoid-associated protein [Chryseobacterium indologenes]|uniref:nucleoid-associated protein n=1 Tax=Chryseobacterium indologenes TaxID=253 RepID=UPI0025753025|nr:nucleoid-associated protein [Chryseobacterium indologenes]MDM1556336.1 nucleoid-associated protein [Chryseobacterium indologenes]
MILKNFFLHHIDVPNNTVTPINLNINPANINSYIGELLNEILQSSNRRTYQFKDGNTEVKSSLPIILDNLDNITEIVQLNSQRLLEKESNIQEIMQRRNMGIEIQKGSLMHLHFFKNDVNQIIICKVEHEEILNEQNFEKVRGLNIRKKVFKAILITFNKNNEIDQNYVFDKHNSKYWWDDFLELKQLYNDDDNTEKSLNEIDKSLTYLKHKFYPDYLILRNSIIGHYRTNDNLNYSDIVSNVVGNYKPISDEFPKDRLVQKIRELPEKKGFDTQFVIKKNKINKKISHRIRLANSLYLSINDYVENLKNIIEPVQDNQGNKYVKILSTEGYDKIKGWINDN